MAGLPNLLPTYDPGTELTLLVDKANEPFPQELRVTIIREITATMSPVFEVRYTDDSPGKTAKRAVLKLYDRRVGSCLRMVSTRREPPAPRREYLPATQEIETAYRGYVRSGKVPALWDEIETDMEQLITLGYPEEYWEPTEEGAMRYEGALQQMVQSEFRHETEAYDKLAHMQGDCIPRMLAHVRLQSTTSSATCPQIESKIDNEDKNTVTNIAQDIAEKTKQRVEVDEPHLTTIVSASSSRVPLSNISVNARMEKHVEEEIENNIQKEAKNKIVQNIQDIVEEKDEDNPCLRVSGVLLEYVSGTPLSDFEDCCPPIDTQKWIGILQDVVNTAEKINRSGVLMHDCRTGNVLLRTEDWQPVFVDFADSYAGDLDDEDDDFGESLCSFNNPFGIVCSLVSSWDGKNGRKFHLTYPDFKDLIRDDDSDSDGDSGASVSIAGKSTPQM